MRYATTGLLAAGLLFALFPLHGQTPTPSPSPAATSAAPRPLAFVVIYRRGPMWDETKDVLSQTGIDAHMQHLRSNSAKLIAAGRFDVGPGGGEGDLDVGMVVVAAKGQAEAEALIAADPAIAGHLMTATVRRWLVQRIKAY